MIVKGKSRGSARQLAYYLLHEEKNERAELFETRGFEPGELADQLEGAELLALANTRGSKTLYHTQIRAAEGERLTAEQWLEAVKITERHLGFEGLPRAIVRHVINGEEHTHVVWDRFDQATGKLRSDSNDAIKRKAAARKIEERFDLRQLDQDRTKERTRTNDDEIRQDNRSAKKKPERVAEITAMWEATDSGKAFRAALEEAGYTLATGKSRAFCVVDERGEVHSLARQIKGGNTADLAARMADLDTAELPQAEAVRKSIRQAQADREREEGKTRYKANKGRYAADRGDDEAFEIDPFRDVRTAPREVDQATAATAAALLAQLGRTRSTWTRSQMAHAAARATGYEGRETWMQQTDGLDGLTPELRASAARSYEAWADEHPRPAARYDLADYVSYAQDREAERLAAGDPALVAKQAEAREAFRSLMAGIEASLELVRVGPDQQGRDRFTSQGQLETEMHLEAVAADLAGRNSHAVRQRTRDTARLHIEAVETERSGKPFSLSADQRAAFNHVTGKEDLSLVVGYAGAGKSTMLNAARAAFEAEGYRVQGAAISGMAADGLEKSAGIKSDTLAQFLHRLDTSDERTVKLAELDARIAGITSRSQKADKFRGDLTRRRSDMAADIAKGRLSERDLIVVDEAAMIGARDMDRLMTAAHQAGAKVVLVGDHEQLQAIEAGAAFRALMDRHGAAQMTEIHRQREDWQRDATRDFATKGTRGALDAYRDHGMTHETETREEAKAALITAWAAGRDRDPNGAQIILTHLRADVADLNRRARESYRAEGRLGADNELALQDGTMTLAEGDRLLFGRNDRQLGVKNGTLSTVEKIEGGKISVSLDERNGGRRLTFDVADYHHIAHGYASTIHKSQGATVERAYVLATDGMDRHSAYVAMTRHRDRADLFYGREDFRDHQAMTKRMGRDGSKDMTLDYLAAAKAGKGFSATFRQAVGNAWKAVRQIFARGDHHPAELAERAREQARAEAERAAKAKAERDRSKTEERGSDLPRDRLAAMFGGKTSTPPPGEKTPDRSRDQAKEADAAARLREDLEHRRKRRRDFDRDG